MNTCNGSLHAFEGLFTLEVDAIDATIRAG
jgi:hypothetical protein